MATSVHSLGILGGIGAGLQGMFGGEVTQVTNIISEGRHAAFSRMIVEAQQRGAAGLTGVSNELRHLKGNIEFLSVASALHREDHTGEALAFSSSSNGQELYCLMDSAYVPRKFVFGNVAYSIGVGGGILGGVEEPGAGGDSRVQRRVQCHAPSSPCSASSMTRARPGRTRWSGSRRA